MKRNRSNLIIDVSQILMWGCVFFLPPVIVYIFLNDLNSFWWSLKIVGSVVLPVYLTYILNYYLLVPKLLFKKRKIAYLIINLLMITVATVDFSAPSEYLDAIPSQLNVEVSESVITAGFAGYKVFTATFHIMVILLAAGLCYAKKWNVERQAIEEERRHHAEAELDWLKNQLNPHFLFNTLNNISSLTQIDSDRAQECISQLSDLLRYALYKTSEHVRIGDEVDFMANYIDLMALRCSPLTKVEKKFDIQDKDLTIVPLLFVSLVENAFKHGTSSHHPSFVTVEMNQEGRTLVFRCSNSVIAKTNGTRYDDSGIGVENTRRRLELVYPDAHSYELDADDQQYTVTVKLFNLGKDV